MSKFGKELIESAQQALAMAGGAPIGRMIEVETPDVAAIRKRLKLSQAKFAERFNLSPATVRDWEQGRRSPDRIATTLLRVIEREPDAVVRALTADAA